MTIPTTLKDLTDALSHYDHEARLAVFTAPNYRMRTVSWGQGPPLLFIHGLADQVRSFAMLMHRLSSRFTCVGIELADGANDGARIGGYRHHHHIEDIIALLNHLRFPRVDVLGSSYGSTITLRLLATQGSRFRKAILQGGFAVRPLMWPERGLARLSRYWPGLMQHAPGRKQVMSKLDLPQFDMAPPEVYQFFLQCSGATPIKAAARRGLILNKLDLRPWLPLIENEVLMIGGDRDTVVPRSSEATVEAGVKNVRRIEYMPCGHYPQYTHTGVMAEDMAAFLGEPGQG